MLPGTRIEQVVLLPILGINTGRLGFISSVAPDQIDKAVNDVLANNYNINRRTLLTLSSTNNLFKNKSFTNSCLFMYKSP